MSMLLEILTHTGIGIVTIVETGFSWILLKVKLMFHQGITVVCHKYGRLCIQLDSEQKFRFLAASFRPSSVALLKS